MLAAGRANLNALNARRHHEVGPQLTHYRAWDLARDHRARRRRGRQRRRLGRSRDHVRRAILQGSRAMRRCAPTAPRRDCAA